ncbi:hypothetical protein SNARM312S_07661 [Streptomyces narbonensis]
MRITTCRTAPIPPAGGSAAIAACRDGGSNEPAAATPNAPPPSASSLLREISGVTVPTSSRRPMVRLRAMRISTAGTVVTPGGREEARPRPDDERPGRPARPLPGPSAGNDPDSPWPQGTSRTEGMQPSGHEESTCWTPPHLCLVRRPKPSPPTSPHTRGAAPGRVRACAGGKERKATFNAPSPYTPCTTGRQWTILRTCPTQGLNSLWQSTISVVLPTGVQFRTHDRSAPETPRDFDDVNARTTLADQRDDDPLRAGTTRSHSFPLSHLPP